MKSLIRPLVPKPLRPTFRSAYNYLHRRIVLIKLFGRYASLIPPLELMHDGAVEFEEFKRNGEEFFRFYTELCGLKPYKRMVDVGCGIGRKTFLLTTYLSARGQL
jgi:hypothetical protein